MIDRYHNIKCPYSRCGRNVVFSQYAGKTDPSLYYNNIKILGKIEGKYGFLARCPECGKEIIYFQNTLKFTAGRAFRKK